MLPVTSQEVETVFSRTYVRESHCMALTSASPDEGVTTLLLALARRHVMAGRSTLVVDLNLLNAGLSSCFEVQKTHWEGFWMAETEVALPDGLDGLAVLPPPSDLNQLIKLREPDVLERAIQEWKQRYDVVLIDTPPLNNLNAGTISSPRICSACDSVVLVVLAGETTDSMVEVSVKKLMEADARLLGTVINDRDNPILKQELLRELDRLERYLPRMTEWLRDKVTTSKMLSLDT